MAQERVCNQRDAENWLTSQGVEWTKTMTGRLMESVMYMDGSRSVAIYWKVDRLVEIFN